MAVWRMISLIHGFRLLSTPALSESPDLKPAALRTSPQILRNRAKIDEKIEANNEVEKNEGKWGNMSAKSRGTHRREWAPTAGGMLKSF